MFGKHNGFASKARVSACMYFLVYAIKFHLHFVKDIYMNHKLYIYAHLYAHKFSHRQCDSITWRVFISILKFLLDRLLVSSAAQLDDIIIKGRWLYWLGLHACVYFLKWNFKKYFKKYFSIIYVIKCLYILSGIYTYSS